MKKKAISLFLALSMSLMMLVGIAPTTMATPNTATVVATVGTGGEIINGFYYENGKIVKAAGIVKVGDDYYYIGMRGQVFVGKVSVTADKTNGLVDAGVYEFGADGKMIIHTASAEIKNGKYYENGQLVKGAGIVKIDNDYYYIGMRGQVFVGTVSVPADKTNGLIDAGVYEFGADGKMVINTASAEIKNGKYYENGQLVKGAGIVKIDNDYYYIGLRGQVFVGTVSVTADKTNGLIEAGVYEFGEDGKMIINTESVQIKNGKYYVNGELVKGAGVVKVNDKFYYIGVRGQVYVGSIYVTADKSNGLIPTGTYEFTADGIEVEVNTDTDTDTATETETETETDTQTETETETDTEISNEIILYEGSGITTSEWEGVKVADLTASFATQQGGVLVAIFDNSYNKQFKFAANNPTWDEILSAYFYDDCITVNSDTMSFTLSSSDAAAFVGKSELWIVGNGVTVKKLVYIPSGNVDTDTDTATETDTDTQTETDTEVEEGIVIYNGSGIGVSGWEGTKVADLTGNFTATKGGVLKATFANSYNGKFKFAANNPTWDEILSAYFYDDCITVNSDTMSFTLSSSDAAAFVGKSELWITGDGVTLKKLVYIPAEDTDTETETETDTQTETDTDSQSDTDVDEIVIYNGAGITASDWEGTKVADLGNFTAKKGGVLVATFANSYNGKFKFAANDPTWIEILSAYFYDDCITVNSDTMSFTLSAFDATSFVGKSELWITGDGVTLKKLVYIPPQNSDTDDDDLTPYEKHGALAVNGRQLVDKNGDAFQLYGMSTHGIAWHPQFINYDTFKNLCDWGVNCIRIAMYTDEYGGYCTYEPNESYLRGKVEDAIRYASELGIYVIVDWHILQDETPLKYKDKALAFFDYISSKYAGYDNILYEICNEPNGSTTWDDVKSYANEVIPLIRGNDSNAVILVGTTSWCLDVHLALQSPLNYDNIMYDFHFYANTHQQYYRNRVASCLNSGLPIFVTEFGTCDASGNGSVNYDEANAWKALIEQYGLSFMCWNLSNQDESSSIILNSCSKTYGWTDSELSDQGRWIKAWFLEKKGTQ